MSSVALPSPAEAAALPEGVAQAAAFRYLAFISYSHRNRKEADWLHAALERFRIPPRLVGRQTPFGPAPARLSPIFRDRDELPASGNLGAELMAALRAARFLLVIASPASSASRWVNEEIKAFNRLHGADRVLAVVVDGVSNSAVPARFALDRALDIYRKALGGPSYVIGISEVYLALIASGQGDLAAALA